MSADLPRRRRSSFSERFQRVFSSDRADQDKKRQSLGPGTPQTPSRVSAQPSDDNDSKSAATAAPSVPDDSGLGSFNFSSDSRVPSLSTTGSSASVRAIHKDEDSTQQMTTEAKQVVELDQVNSSPTWKKDTPRKERRATKRLEAERKELEKRMLQLEQNQTQADGGNSDRSSRRLVKKQKASSERSSSAGSSRLRSSSIGRFFTRSRRGSQTGIDSANESDIESARGSADANPAAPVPPSIPLALEERFGADVSRELATRHGTTLLPANQLASNQSRSVSSQHPQKSQRLHHTPLKSDDLRENWKMAEEWQKTQGGEPGPGFIKPDSLVGGRQSPRASLYGTDLDQEFTVTPKNGRKTPKTPNIGSPSAGAATDQLGLSSTNTLEGIPQDADPSAMRITTVKQQRDFSSSMSEDSSGSNSTVDIQSSMPVEKYPTRNRVESTPQSYQRVYKSSPLAMNPNSPDSPTQSSNDDPSLRTDKLDLPKPLRISKIPQFEGPLSRNQQLAPVSSSEQAQSQPKRASPGKNRESLHGSWPLTGNDIQQENRNSQTDYQEPPIPRGSSNPPHAIAPPKHPGRRSLEDHTPKWTSNRKPTGSTASDGARGSKEPQIHHLSPRRVTDGGISPADWNDPDHRRSSISSLASSYNTADEEKLDVPPGRSKRASLPAPERKEAKPAPTEVAIKETPTSATSPRTNPVASGSINMLRKAPMQKMKPPRSDDVLTKLFVICCQCKYWHDMPSDVSKNFFATEFGEELDVLLGP
ncbi:uncharacterized protein N7503_002767 [Penicillium pulvis]|uniref:uncharacterized protein n=1 Tax=Penicillium pulvis TaxID=1562058 RepID=UPI0025482F72|nr:uncharacterized protein N7503_002767 [Penicillium pulvis]KAJ5810549.1 hypothetical protein N7503_002767 [Penicillium pulvis]